MTDYFVEIVGPYDGCVIGPFASMVEAEAYSKQIDRNVFNVEIYDRVELEKTNAMFGELDLHQPGGFGRPN